MTSGTNQVEALIAEGLGDQLLIPSDPSYETRIESWWALNSRLRPACIVQPRTPQDVSRVVKVLASLSNGRFAVRSGGHCCYANGSNVDDGVTIDLCHLNQVVYDDDSKLASLGPGQAWASVYEALEPKGVMVAGCRASSVGVGGFILGGGFSYYVGQQGFACDNVVNYQVVLADGRIVDANAKENPDLWKALRGGSTNLGIVTRFDMETFPARNLWGGIRSLNKSSKHEALKTFSDFVANNHTAPEAVLAVDYTYTPHINVEEPVLVQFLADANGVVNPPIFKEALEIPEIFTNVKTQPMSQIGVVPFPPGCWITEVTMTFKNDLGVMEKACELFDAFLADLFKVIDPKDLQAECLLQPLPKFFSDISVKKGGNVMGHDAYESDCVVWAILTRLKTKEQEALVLPKIHAVKDTLEQYARENGAFVPWEYLNYCDPLHNPLKSYGSRNLQFIREVAQKYDPKGFFQSQGEFTITKAG